MGLADPTNLGRVVRTPFCDRIRAYATVLYVHEIEVLWRRKLLARFLGEATASLLSQPRKL